VKPLTASFFQWDKDPAAYETARVRLAALILSAPGRGKPTPARLPRTDLLLWRNETNGIQPVAPSLTGRNAGRKSCSECRR